jgi:hypothetical protein
VFFFLRRWTQGIGDPSSYGQGSGGAERVPAEMLPWLAERRAKELASLRTGEGGG